MGRVLPGFTRGLWQQSAFAILVQMGFLQKQLDKQQRSLQKRLIRPARRLWNRFIYALGLTLEYVVEFGILCFLWLRAARSAAYRQDCVIDVGIGPEPLINHVYHKRALEAQGYRVETFVWTTYMITQDFDVNSQHWPDKPWLSPYLNMLWKDVRLFCRVIAQYKALFIHFHGGPLHRCRLLSRFEPQLYRRAGVKVLVSPYGSDVQDLNFMRSLPLKYGFITDYPTFYQWHPRVSQNETRWAYHADYVLSGCDWVDYMHHWDRLVVTDWCIDVEDIQSKASALKALQEENFSENKPFRILHAPNHTEIKGTRFIQAAVKALQAEGVAVELVLLRGVPNDKILATIASVDLVIDQLIVGWYGFFALEAMASGKPVMAFLKPDYLELFEFAGLLELGEVPVLQADYQEIQAQLRQVIENRAALPEIGARSLTYVRKHHSLEHIGRVFAEGLAHMGMHPKERKKPLVRV